MYTIKSYKIIGTQIRVFSCFEPYAGHSTITHDDQGKRLGRVGTRPLPPDLASLPPLSDQRSSSVKGWQSAQYMEAYRAIIQEYPEAALGSGIMGEIELIDA